MAFWEQIYQVGGIVVAIGSFPSLVKSLLQTGATALLLATGKTRDFIKKVLVSVCIRQQAAGKVFTKADIGAEALHKGFPISGVSRRALNRLEEAEVLLVRLEDVTGTPSYMAVYKGEILVPASSAKELRETMKKALNKSGKGLEKELGKMLSLAEGAGSSKFITKAKNLDKTATLGKVQQYENQFQFQKVEYGVVLKGTGEEFLVNNNTLGAFTDNKAKSVNIPTRVDLITKTKKRIFLHNHPESSPLSALDIKTFIQGDFEELRAICRNGDVYSIKKIGKLPSGDKDYSNFIKKIIKTINNNFDELYRKAKSGDKVAGFELDQVIADLWIEGLGDSIEYIKYH